MEASLTVPMDCRLQIIAVGQSVGRARLYTTPLQRESVGGGNLALIDAVVLFTLSLSRGRVRLHRCGDLPTVRH